jgi:glucosamine--fructose-6-phosphate aminotransferase (isomerizing)
MCGIIGYTGPSDVLPLLVRGLTTLEYRGYDSAGVAVVDHDGDLQVVKRSGKLSNLRDALEGHSIEGNTGLGHTRWATHGEPNDPNSHPHTDASGNIALIHNGIFENYAELKAELVAAGHAFTSDTDTEVVAHLIGSLREEQGGPGPSPRSVCDRGDRPPGARHHRRQPARGAPGPRPPRRREPARQ